MREPILTQFGLIRLLRMRALSLLKGWGQVPLCQALGLAVR